MIQERRSERSVVCPCMFSIDSGPANPDRTGSWWRRARERAGIDAQWRLHDLRHWPASTAITSGHHVRTVAGRLCHANAAMTLRVYVHAVQVADKAVAETLAAALGSTHATCLTSGDLAPRGCRRWANSRDQVDRFLVRSARRGSRAGVGRRGPSDGDVGVSRAVFRHPVGNS